MIVSAEGYPGKNCIALILDDQPCLADGVVNHPEEPILLLAHADRHKLPKAIAAVTIDYEELPPVITIEESESECHGTPNHLGHGQYFQEFFD